MSTEAGGGEMGEAREWTVTPAQAGTRLDVFLVAALGVSRAEARRLIASGEVAVDGRAAREKGLLLESGRRVGVRAWAPRPQQWPIAEPEAPLVVLAEGDGWVAVDKPAGRGVHPLAPGERGSVLGAVVARYPEILGVGEGGLRSGVVHRLDVDTTGVLLFATAEPRWQSLRAAFREHRVAKRYRAIVQGELRGEGELRLRLTVTQHRPARVRVVEPGDPAYARGSRATSARWRAVEALRGATLVEIRPRTGFLHQIRVSLAHLGHPVLGDLAYGAEPHSLAPRHLLHAAAVRTGDVRAESPDPEDFAAARAALARGGC